LLIPTYTPIRTDETDVSLDQVFFGGINVYLQLKVALFRHTPRFLDRLFDFPNLLRWVSDRAMKVEAEQLGAMTVAMLQGSLGPIRKEGRRLAEWLANEVKPDIVNLTNVLLTGVAPEIKRLVKKPILVSLQGDDIFLDALPEPYRSRTFDLIRQHSRHIDGYIATSAYYADYMAGYLGIERSRIHVVYPGLNLAGHDGTGRVSVEPPYTIGYFARICPAKGLHTLVEAFRLLKQQGDAPPARLRVSGYLGPNDRAYFDELQARIKNWGLADHFEHVESPDHTSKLHFLQSLDVLSVPTSYREPKGLYVLEAMANGVPVVQPRHGSFPELIEATGGGILVNPDDPADLARGLRRMLDDHDGRREMGRRGREAVRQRFGAANMAAGTVAVYRQYVA
jgi:glycosyltransferase involved in cell wall biosynthesis